MIGRYRRAMIDRLYRSKGEFPKLLLRASNIGTSEVGVQLPIYSLMWSACLSCDMIWLVLAMRAIN